jgi:hypothetical protein
MVEHIIEPTIDHRLDLTARTPMPLRNGPRRPAGKPLFQHHIIAVISVHGADLCAVRAPPL